MRSTTPSAGPTGGAECSRPRSSSRATRTESASTGRYVWKSKLPYRLEFFVRTTKVEKPRLLEGNAEGELAGVGRWRLFEQGGVTAVLYEWNVRTTRAWMNLLAPVARPIFAVNHDYVMRNGGEGLARLLGGALLARD